MNESVKNETELESLGEKGNNSEEIFNGLILHVFRDKVTLPDGKPAVRELIRHVGAVAILPVTDDGRVYLERQYRYPVGKVITEVPAGKLDYLGEDRLEAAKRELREETGLTASEWIDLGEFHPAAAYCDEKLTLYIAKGLSRGERELDEDEFLDVFCVHFSEIFDEVMAGKVTDAKTQTLILKAAVYLGYLKR